MEVFWNKGFEATSIADLTAAMGINPPSLYAAFGDKEQLFLSAVERYTARRGAVLSLRQRAHGQRCLAQDCSPTWPRSFRAPTIRGAA